MKKLTVFAALSSISLLAALLISQAFASTPKEDTANNGGNPGDPAAAPVSRAHWRVVAPLFDSNGMVVSNPSGLALERSRAGSVQIAPVFDANGEVISDPTGTLWKESQANGDMQVAPVFDNAGNVVSDPSGTILNATNP